VHHAPAPLDTRALVAELAARTPAHLAAAAGVAPGGGFDLADGLDVHEAEVLVLFTAPELRLARRAHDVVAAGRVAAGRWQDPVLGVDGAAVLAPRNLLEYGVGLEFTLPVLGSARSEQRAADAEAEVARAEVAALEWRTRSELRGEWLRWSALDERARAEERLARAFDDFAASAERWRAAGALSALEARLVATRAVAQRVEVESRLAQAEAARLALLATLGLSAASALELVPESNVRAAPARLALDELAARSPQLAAVRARHAFAEARLARELRRQYPDVSLGLGYGSEDEDDRVLFGLALPLPLWNRNARAIAVALAERELERERYEIALADLEQAEAAARVRHERALARRDLVEGQLLPLVEAAAADLALLERSGRVEIAHVLEALAARREALAAKAEVAIELALAVAELEALTGPDPSEPAPAGAAEPPSTASSTAPHATPVAAPTEDDTPR
jgi:outer membrane protein TolC